MKRLEADATAQVKGIEKSVAAKKREARPAMAARLVPPLLHAPRGPGAGQARSRANGRNCHRLARCVQAQLPATKRASSPGRTGGQVLDTLLEHVTKVKLVA